MLKTYVNFRTVCKSPLTAILRFPYNRYFSGEVDLDSTYSEIKAAQAEKKEESRNLEGQQNKKEEEKRKLEEEFLELRKTLDAVTVLRDDFKEKYFRALAETENVRQRCQKDIEQGRLFALQNFSKSLIQVADLFELVIKNVTKEPLNISDKVDKIWTEMTRGLIMTEKELHKVFREHGLVSYNPLGEKFDPNYHEALFEVVDNEKEPGTITLVQKLGYQLNGRTLRAAVVGVSKKA